MMIPHTGTKSKHIFGTFVLKMLDIRINVRYYMYRTDVRTDALTPGGRIMNTTAEKSEIRERRIRRNRIRRERQLRRRMVVAASALILITASSLGYTSFMSRASEAGYEDYRKIYESVVIPYGSTLESLGSQYMDSEHYDDLDSYIDEVKFINHLPDDKIIAGHYLIMPSYVK